jgi:hypothetical protein
MILLFWACTAPDEPTDLVVGPGAIPPTLEATWTSLEPTLATVETRFGDETLLFTEAVASTTHSVNLFGVPATSPVNVRVLVDDVPFAEADATSPGLPTWVPDFDFVSDVPEAIAPGLTLVPVFIEMGGGVVIVDERGRTVWAYPPEDEARELIFRARLSLDGQHVLYNGQATSAEAPGKITSIALDGSTATSAPITSAHTDFVEYTPGGYVSIGWEIREVEGRKILGDTLVERSPEGVERRLWSTWDSFEPDMTQTYPNLYAADPEVEDWSHVNGLHYDPTEDALYATMTFNNGVAKVDRASGELVWVLSNVDGDFTLETPDLLQLPHSVELLDNGNLLVFNRGQLGTVDGYSHVDELVVDQEARTASEAWSYTDPDRLLVAFLGSAQRLENDNTLITWTSAGKLNEVTQDGAVAWQISTSIGAGFGFSSRYPRPGE